LETDCAGAVAKLKAPGLDRSTHGPLVDKIKEALRVFEGSLINHVRSLGNVVAYYLAKEGCKNKCNEVWLDVLPDHVLNLVAGDAVA
jgi:hypothetical protein